MEMVGGKGVGAPLDRGFLSNSAFDVPARCLAKELVRGLRISEKFKGLVGLGG